MAEPPRDRVSRSHDTIRSYIHQLYGLERPGEKSGERERHSAPPASDLHRAREAAASASRASRLSEQRPTFWHSSLAKVRGSVNRQLSKESTPPAEVIDRVIANKLETIKTQPGEAPAELNIRNVTRHDKRFARPVSSREKQQRIAAWLLHVERALGERRRQHVSVTQLPSEVVSLGESRTCTQAITGATGRRPGP